MSLWRNCFIITLHGVECIPKCGQEIYSQHKHIVVAPTYRKSFHEAPIKLYDKSFTVNDHPVNCKLAMSEFDWLACELSS